MVYSRSKEKARNMIADGYCILFAKDFPNTDEDDIKHFVNYNLQSKSGRKQITMKLKKKMKNLSYHGAYDQLIENMLFLIELLEKG